MRIASVEINCDMGEGMPHDFQIMPMVSSCNIACGGHTGNRETMRAVVGAALDNKVMIGAHPSYPDKKNFGRAVMDIPKRRLRKSLRAQIADLLGILEEMGGDLHHIKAHGALYHATSYNKALAELYLDILEPYRPSVFLYVPYGSQLEVLAATQGFKVRKEAFLDRNYQADLHLVPRTDPGAVISDPEQVQRQLINMVRNRTVIALDTARIPIKADTYCVHSDNPAILEILHYLTAEFDKNDLRLQK